MRKKYLGLLLFALSLFGLITGAQAETEKVEAVYDWTSLWLCTTTGDATVCKLDNDITVKGLSILKPVTIDLNQHKIILDRDTPDVRIGIQTDGKVILENGEIISEATYAHSIVTISAKTDNNVNTELELKNVQMSISCDEGFGIIVDQRNDEGYSVESSTITVDEKSSVTSANRVAIVNYGTATINVYGTVVSKNTGSAIEGSQSAPGATNINIFEGANVTSAKGVGILLMSDGTVTVSGGEVSGNSGIALTNGDLKILGGLVTGFGVLSTEVSEDAFGHIDDNGAAVYIEPSDETNVDIKNGTLTSKQGFAISAPGTNEQNQKLNIQIENGTFASAKGGIEINEDTPRAAFIEAGATFLKNGEPDEDVLTYTNDLEISEGGVIGKVYDITVEKSENGEVKVNKDAAVGETVKIDVIAAKGYKVGKIIVTYTKDGKDEEVTVTDSSFVMPDGAVKIAVTFVKTDDTLANENPATYDNILTYVGLVIASTGILTVASKKLLKNK